MVENYRRQSALAHLGLNARAAPPEPAGVKLCEISVPGQVGLRLEATDKTCRGLAEKALGLALPVKANTAAMKGKKTALWLGPDEWLLIVSPAQGDKLGKALKNHHAAVFDVSDSRVVISLSGRHARDVLKKGCGLDLHRRAFGPGQCAQSTLALAHVLIHQVAQIKKSGAATYHLYVHRSFAPYMWAWLEDAGGEYGVEVSSD